MILVLPLLAYFVLLVRSRDLPASVSWWRRNAYAIVLGLAASVPVLPTLFLDTTIGRGLSNAVDEDGQIVSVATQPYAIDWSVVLLACWLVLWPAMQFIRSPKLPAVFENLASLDDEEVVQSIGSMSAALGMRPPRVVQSRTEHGFLVNACAADGLCPTVIVGDGVMHTMDSRQREAVLAHELGHLASHIGAWRVIIAMCAAIAAVLVSGWVSLYVAGMWLVAAGVMASVAYSHRAEFAADRLAASIVGADEMIAAVATLDAASGFSAGGSPRLHGLLSHPHFDERKARLLAERAPADVCQNARSAARARVTSWLLCLLLLLGSVVLGSFGWTGIALVLGVLVACAPTVSNIAVQPWGAVNDARKLGVRFLHPVLRVRVACWVAVVLSFGLAVAIRGDTASVLTVASSVWLLGALAWGAGELRIRGELGQHLAAHEWQEWLRVYDAAPQRVRQRRDLWGDAMEVTHHVGDQERAQDEYAGLIARYPDYLHASLFRAGQLRPVDSAAAVELLRSVAEHVPESSHVHGALASALRVHGDFDAAWASIQQAIALRPGEDWLHAVACRVAIARGELAVAAQELQAAKGGGAADLLTIIAEAHLAVVERRPEAAELVAACEARVAQEPLRNNESEVAGLVAMLAEVRGSTGQEHNE